MTISLAIYLDRNYLQPAAALLQSIRETQSEDIQVFILSLNLSPDEKFWLMAYGIGSLAHQWCEVDLSGYQESFRSAGYLSQAAYARLLVGELLPPDLSHVISLDCDGLIQADLKEVWCEPPRETVLRAVPDPCVFTLADDETWTNPSRHNESIPYFNSGFLYIDLARWRRERIQERCLLLAKTMSLPPRYADQSLLNAILRGEWEPLDVKWNCNERHLMLHGYPSFQDRIYSYTQVKDAQKNPGFIHFLSRQKPWHGGFYHPHRNQYFRVLARALGKVPSAGFPTEKLVINKYLRRCFQQLRQLIRDRGISSLPFRDYLHYWRLRLKRAEIRF